MILVLGKFDIVQADALGSKTAGHDRNHVGFIGKQRRVGTGKIATGSFRVDSDLGSKGHGDKIGHGRKRKVCL